MNNTTLILNIGPVNDQNRAIKLLAATEWSKLNPTQSLIPIFDNEDSTSILDDFGFTPVPCPKTVRINNKPYPIFSEIFDQCNKRLLPQIENIIYTNGDIVPITEPKEIERIINSCDRISKQDYIGLIHRYNFGRNTKLEIKNLKNLIDQQPINYPGVDSFVCSRLVYERLTYSLPPLIMTVYGPDRWLLDWSFRCVDRTFFLEQSIKTAHITHPTRKEAVLGSKNYLTSKNPLIEYNRQHINLSLKEIFNRMNFRDLQFTNGVTLQEVYRQW